VKIASYISFLVLFALSTEICAGQDPNFAQFFSSPLNMNPALTANINADWRLISNFRNQWIGPASPYVTGTVSYDRKINRKKWYDEEEGNRWGIGTMLMYDIAMSGVAKNSYASLNLSYNAKLTEGDVVNRIAAGFGGIYGRKYVDFSRLDFEEQFVGDGFNTTLPTGEEALANMKPYLSISGGVVYSRTSEKMNMDFGIASFHVNNPKQTFLKDPNQRLIRRDVIHANTELFLNDYLLLNANITYQRQGTARYYSFGSALGYQLSNDPSVILNAGIWYWSENCITPYLGFNYEDFQFGVTYDITVSKLNNAPRRANSFEISMILRGMNRENKPKGIPCPWK
jgi:type IX secretion system PorP/SprF family membrane protein